VREPEFNDDKEETDYSFCAELQSHALRKALNIHKLICAFMRWFRRSARERILRDISFGKRGEVARGSESSQGAQDAGRKGLWTAAILLVGIVIVVFLAGYLSSAAGQRALQDVGANVRAYTLDPIADFFAGIYTIGGGDYFSAKTNTSSTRKGIDLVDFRSITGDVVPEGKDFDILYDIEFINVPRDRAFVAEFDCHFNKTVGSSEQTITGEILPQNPLTIQTGSTVICRIYGDDTEGITKATSFYGSFSFDFVTEDATLPVYFIPGEVADQLNGEDFFAAYDLDVSQSDLRTVYNGEPISIGIGVGGEGEEQQPVIVRTGEAIVYNTVGITLKNEWNGDLVRLEDLTLTLPQGVELNDELNGEPSLSCPFVSLGSERAGNIYGLDEGQKENLFTDYFQDDSFFGRTSQHTFQCWLAIDETLLGDAPYVVKNYIVEAKYRYKVKEQIETVTIKAGSLVA